MPDKQYIFVIHLRGQRIWCHATNPSHAISVFTEQTKEPIEDYGLEWERPKNLDGSPITDAEYNALWGIN
jgi:hypothetical protein